MAFIPDNPVLLSSLQIDINEAVSAERYNAAIPSFPNNELVEDAFNDVGVEWYIRIIMVNTSEEENLDIM